MTKRQFALLIAFSCFANGVTAYQRVDIQSVGRFASLAQEGSLESEVAPLSSRFANRIARNFKPVTFDEAQFCSIYRLVENADRCTHYRGNEITDTHEPYGVKLVMDAIRGKRECFDQESSDYSGVLTFRKMQKHDEQLGQLEQIIRELKMDETNREGWLRRCGYLLALFAQIPNCDDRTIPQRPPGNQHKNLKAWWKVSRVMIDEENAANIRERVVQEFQRRIMYARFGLEAVLRDISDTDTSNRTLSESGWNLIVTSEDNWRDDARIALESYADVLSATCSCLRNHNKNTLDKAKCIIRTYEKMRPYWEALAIAPTSGGLMNRFRVNRIFSCLDTLDEIVANVDVK
jgi:hypothetical protein